MKINNLRLASNLKTIFYILAKGGVLCTPGSPTRSATVLLLADGCIVVLSVVMFAAGAPQNALHALFNPVTLGVKDVYVALAP